MISAVKRWLMRQGFTERVAVLIMWQAVILLSVALIVLAVMMASKAK